MKRFNDNTLLIYNINTIMGFLTNDKLVIVGAGGAIGSTMVQTALTMKLTPNVCLYDVYAPGMEGVMEEMFHCGYDSVNLTATTDVAEAFKDAKYIISTARLPRNWARTSNSTAPT